MTTTMMKKKKKRRRFTRGGGYFRQDHPIVKRAEIYSRRSGAERREQARERKKEIKREREREEERTSKAHGAISTRVIGPRAEPATEGMIE